MSEYTKKKAAEILKVSQKEIVRMINRGELKARKKTKSKFSDYLVTLPNVKVEKGKTKEVIEKEIKEKSKPKEKEKEQNASEIIEQEIKEKKPEEILEEKSEERHEEAKEIQAEIEESAKLVKEERNEIKPDSHNHARALRERRLAVNKRKEGKTHGTGKGKREDKWWF